MNFTVEIDASQILPQELQDQIKLQAQGAMADAFLLITIGNFGPGEGIDRPISWPDLNPIYAIKKHDGDVTPTEILSTDLLFSIQVEKGNIEFAECYTEMDYAEIQQWGGNWGRYTIPARPFMPLVGDENMSELTDYSAQKCLDAAQLAVESVLK